MSALPKPRPIPEIVHKAAALVREGYAVFPCLENKAPACPRGFKDAVGIERDVHALWQAYHGPLIGVATGQASGICVLDLDLQHDSAQDWLAEHATRLNGHRTHRTRSGGTHILFQHRDGVRNRAGLHDAAGQRTQGVDIRGAGGYIIWWPAAGLDVLTDITPRVMPAWLAELATPAPPPKADLAKIENGLRHAERYIQAAVRSAVRIVAHAPQGMRNDALNAETFALARFIPQGHLTTAQVVEAMATAALQAGLSASEIERTIASALKARSAQG